MVREKVTVKAKSGLHARPANLLIKTAQKYKCKVEIEVDNKIFNAKSLIGILAAGIDCGTEVSVICTGDDEEAASKEVVELITGDMGEE
ncbi:MAG: HPr family phosphocarrier protein [Lachnospiraceae bacterium]|nr:HPr family phosphocarrier protein [Lachnospiraceae bacterium]